MPPMLVMKRASLLWILLVAACHEGASVDDNSRAATGGERQHGIACPLPADRISVQNAELTLAERCDMVDRALGAIRSGLGTGGGIATDDADRATDANLVWVSFASLTSERYAPFWIVGLRLDERPYSTEVRLDSTGTQIVGVHRGAHPPEP
jgi:hypothetical protein